MRSRKIRALFDCDGVFADFVQGLINIANRSFSVTITKEDLPDWQVIDDVARLIALRSTSDLPINEVKEFLHDRVSSPGFCADLPIYEGAREAMERIRAMEGLEFYIVTSPWNAGKTWMYEREQWLRRFLDVHHRNVLHCSAKHLVHGDLFVDDKPEHAIEWGEQWGNSGAFLWDTHHNRRYDGRPLKRLKSWAELEEMLEARLGR